MKIKQIIIGLILLIFLTTPVMAAAGEGNVKVIDKDGNVVDNAVHKSHDSDSKDNIVDIGTNDSKSDTDNSENFEVGDVWGIEQNDMDFSDYTNINTLGGIYSGITPFRNMSLISIAISMGLALTFVLVGVFLLVMIAGYGAGHPNVEKGWKYIHSSQGKIVAVGGVFLLALFIIITIFFSLYVFSRISIAV